MLSLAVTFVLIVAASAQFPDWLHLGFHNHNELGSMTFYYDDQSNYLVARTKHHCYFMSLTADQIANVHHPDGMEKDELAMIQMIAGGEDTLTHAQQLDHASSIDHMCYNHDLFMVGAVSTKAPHTTMPN